MKMYKKICFAGDISAFSKLSTKLERKNFLVKMWFFSFFFSLLIALFPFSSLWSVSIMKGKQMKPVHDRNWNSPTWKTICKLLGVQTFFLFSINIL